jgi:NifU-like protein
MAQENQFFQPRNVGEVDCADAVADIGSLTCGGILHISLKIDCGLDSGKRWHLISEARFRAAGCSLLVSLASALTERIKGMQVGEAARLAADEGGELYRHVPPEKRHCAALCRDAVQEAAVCYRRKALDDWNGDEALICTCFGVSENSIEASIRTGGLRTVEDVTDACNAGGGCGSCRPLTYDIIERFWTTL